LNVGLVTLNVALRTCDFSQGRLLPAARYCLLSIPKLRYRLHRVIDVCCLQQLSYYRLVQHSNSMARALNLKPQTLLGGEWREERDYQRTWNL